MRKMFTGSTKFPALAKIVGDTVADVTRDLFARDS